MNLPSWTYDVNFSVFDLLTKILSFLCKIFFCLCLYIMGLLKEHQNAYLSQ